MCSKKRYNIESKTEPEKNCEHGINGERERTGRRGRKGRNKL